MHYTIEIDTLYDIGDIVELKGHYGKYRVSSLEILGVEGDFAYNLESLQECYPDLTVCESLIDHLVEKL